MKKMILCPLAVWVGVFLVQSSGMAQSPQAGATSGQSSQAVRPIGVVTQIEPGKFTLHTDAGPDLLILLPDEVSVLRVPPGAKDLKTAAKIGVSDISSGDRVLVRGKFANDQKSVLATSVIVMTKTDLASAHEAERLEWQRRGIGGLVKAVDPATKEITISVPNTPPTPGNPTHPVRILPGANVVLLRYAPDSVKFSDAKPSTLEEIKVGDQVRALGTKSEDGTRYTAERLVSGTFRNVGATVVSVDATRGSVTVKDLASGNPLMVRTNADSKLHRLPEFVARMIAAFNSGDAAGGGMPGRPPEGGPGGTQGGRQGRWQGNGQGGGGGGGMGGGPRDFNQMLERTPPLALSELKSGDALIVVSTEGAKASEVTAIVLLAGVEPILSTRPKGSNEVNLGQWNWSMGGGDSGP
jgi:hypothetical protein